MTPEASIEELRARIQLAEGSATLLLAVAVTDAALDDTRRVVLELLRATPLELADLGACAIDTGPARWAELTRARAAGAYALLFSPDTPLAAGAFARVLNAERELLRQLTGPVVLLISRATEKALRQQAPDFFTWVAHGYELPEPRELQTLATRLGVAPERPDAAPPEDPLRFLHVSDLHLRPQRVKRYDQDRVLDGLIAFLEHDRAAFPLDLLFVTGDLAHAGRPEEYALVVAFLEKLMAVTGVPAERVFVVPGNHDVDREVGRWLLRTPTRDEDAVAFFEEPRSRLFHEHKLAAYRDGLRPLLGADRALGLGVGAEAVEIVELRGARLAVASFNTAWFAQGDDDHGKLWIGEPDVEHAADAIADREALFAVALMHHPFEDLHEIERDTVERWFERSFDLVLRGHLHAGKTRSIAGQRGGFVEVAGPAAYQGSQWPNGCFLGEIRPRARSVRLRPYMYASGPDPWVLDPKVFPDDEGDGYCKSFTVPEKKRTKSVVTQPLREAAEAAVRKASPAMQREMARRMGPPGSADASYRVQSLASQARSLAESPELWSELLGKDSSDVALAHALVTAVHARPVDRGRIDITATDAFEQALLLAGRTFQEVTTQLGVRGQLLEATATRGFAAALGAVAEVSVATGVPLGKRGRADIAIHRKKALDALFDMIEVKRVSPGMGPGLKSMIAAGLQHLDAHLEGMPRVRGALVLIDALPFDAAEPTLELVKTPAGHEVRLLRL